MGASTGTRPRPQPARKRSVSRDPLRQQSGRFARITKGTTGQLERMRRATVYADGAFPAKVKALAAMLWSIAERCEPCLEHYARRARTLGATEAEVGEFLALAGALGGCIGETWARKAFAAFSSAGNAPRGSTGRDSG